MWKDKLGVGAAVYLCAEAEINDPVTSNVALEERCVCFGELCASTGEKRPLVCSKTIFVRWMKTALLRR